MNAITKALRRIVRPQAPRILPSRVRKFEGGMHDRLTASWTSGTTSINSEIRNSLLTLRARSRDLYNNNEYGRAFFNMLVSNVVGPDGVNFQSTARQRNGMLDVEDNDRLETRMAEWSKRGKCDVTRRMTRSVMERMFVLGLARDGEVLVRKYPGFGNDQRFALEFIDPDLLDIDHSVDEGRDQNRIVMGVEVDRFNAPVAYHFLTKHPSPFGQPATTGTERIRVPAAEVIHAFIQLRPHQVRGIPWVHAAMRALRDLGGYREAAVIASRIGAAKTGFWKSEDGLGAPYDGMDSVGNLVDVVEPGRFQQLPEGVSLESWDPTYPHDQFEAFNKAMLRGLSSGLGVAYFNLNNDMESVNLSSARIGQQNERDLYKSVQNMLIEYFHDDWYPEWLTIQLGLLNIPPTRFQRFENPSWLPRTWQSPDPLKDAQTADLYLKNHLTSAPRIIRERGMDPDEILRETEQWNARLAEIGLTMQSASQGTSNESTQTEDETDTQA